MYICMGYMYIFVKLRTNLQKCIFLEFLKLFCNGKCYGSGVHTLLDPRIVSSHDGGATRRRRVRRCFEVRELATTKRERERMIGR
jgi:hypothetical protein